MKLSKSICTAAAIAALASSGALAQDSLYFSDEIVVELSAPRYFQGLYLGVMLPSGVENQHDNIITQGSDVRWGGGLRLGWNEYITDSVLAGIEARGIVSGAPTNWGGEAYLMGRIGLLAGPDFMFYVTGGVGVVDQTAVVAFGPGVEWRLFDNISARLEGLGLVQAGPSALGISIPNVTGLSVNAGVSWHFDDAGLDGWGIVTASADQPMDFSGLYAGAGFGDVFNGTYNFFPDTGYGLHPSRLDLGGFVGYNFQVSEWLLAGIEAQAGVGFDSSGDGSYNILGLGKLGIVPFNRLMLYAAGGVGVVQDKPAYAIGGGAEYAFWDNASARFEFLGLGEIGNAAAPGITAYKGVAGVVWHFN